MITSCQSRFAVHSRTDVVSGMSKQYGLSLVELMVAVTLGLILLAAVTTLFVDTSRTNTEMAKMNAQIENGRFAIQLLENDVVHAGFWGGYVPQFDDLTFAGVPTDVPALQLPVDTVPAPCQDYATWNAAYRTKLLGLPMQAYAGVPAGCEAVVTNKLANTDVLLVRHAATCVAGLGGCPAIVANALYFQASRCENEIGAATPLVYKFEGAADAAGSNFTLKKRGCTGTPPAATVGTIAEIRKFTSNIYYIRNYAVTPGDGIPTLMRSEFDLSGGVLGHKTAEPLINGIEGFRVEFGIDNLSDDGTNILTGVHPPDPADPDLLYTKAIKWADPDSLVSPRNRGDGIPDGAYVHGPVANIAQLSHVVSAKLYVLARADKPTPGHTDNKTYRLGSTTLGPFNDAYKRHVFSTTVRLHNISGRRETP